MYNLSELCLMGLRLGGNYVKWFVISMGLGGAKRCGGGFKVIILTGWGKASHKEGTSFYGGI